MSMTKANNFTRKDEINATSATPLQNAKNEVVTVVGGAITTRPDPETGEEVTVGYLVTNEYGTMSTISKTAIRGLDMIVDYMADENINELPVMVKSGKSNAGREFITLQIQ